MNQVGGYMNQAGAQPSGNETRTFIVGFWGSSLSGQGCRARSRVLYASARLQTRSTEFAGIRPSVNRQSETGSQRTRRLRFPSYA